MIKRLATWISRANWRRLQRRLVRRRDAEYRRWVAAHDQPTPEQLAVLQARVQAAGATVQIGLVVWGEGADAQAWQRTLDAALAQHYVHWQLGCVPGPGVPAATQQIIDRAVVGDTRIRCLAGSPALALAAMDVPWLALLQAGDGLPAHAFSLLAEALTWQPQVEVVYGDDDELDSQGQRCRPNFKPDWNPELLLARNYLGRPVWWSHARLQQALAAVGPAEDNAAFAHALALSAAVGLDTAQVLHIPHVLCHGSSPVADAAPAFVQRHLQRQGLQARVLADALGGNEVHLAPPAGTPRVSVIVPTRDQLHLLRTCITSVRQRTRYANVELIVVDNGSQDPDTLQWLAALATEPDVQVLRDDGPFNYSALNNGAVARAQGEFVLLLNNDTEVINPEWLDEMLGLAALPGVGAVGARLWFDDMSLQHAGLVLGLDGVAGYAHRRLRPGAAGYQGRAHLLQAVSAVTAACLLVRKSAYLQVGGLDEGRFAVAYNDVDLCLKLNQAGHRTLWTPHAQLFHYESRSRGSDEAPEHTERFRAEFAAMRQRWGPLLDKDPAYNPNLTLANGAYRLAWPPRVSLDKPWFDA